MRAVLGLLALLAGNLHASNAHPPAGIDVPGFVGAERCRACHTAEYESWKSSHHDLAMQIATPETVLGDFNDSQFVYAGLTSRFFREGDTFYVETESADGKPGRYEVAYVFGVYPLQQYLIPFPGGRLQALSIAWDTRPAGEGGQRWFHLYPDEAITAGDSLHWTGPYQNWNLQCAECHSTRLDKNYLRGTKGYATTWSEINVACEACHGPGASHVELAETNRLSASADKGLALDLGERGAWFWPENADIARRTEPLAASRQVEACGRCHARRSPLGDYEYGQHLFDTHRVSLLRDPLYHADGQILDEVYVYGSFVQSKMHQAGVVCSNCHDPHSAELRTPGNAICTQCHKPGAYDTVEHHHHPAGSAGAQCANCHMPTRNYMVVDPRRDHSMRIPRPDLSVMVGTPNACNGCHSEKSADWAVDQLREWGASLASPSSHPARSLTMTRQGNVRGAARLAELAGDPGAPPIWRATALTELGAFVDRDVIELALELLEDDNPMLRLGAVQALEALPLEQLYPVLAAHIDDPSQSVRLEIARALAAVPMEQLEPGAAAKLGRLLDEYEATLLLHSDVPESLVQLGALATARGDRKAAEQAYLEAIAANRDLLVAYMNLADLYRSTGRENKGRTLLLDATRVAPTEAAPWHALGLLEVRAGAAPTALEYLGKAAQLERQGTRYRYVYGIALHDSGNVDAALATLKPLLRETPDDPEVLIALATWSAELGRRGEARGYAGKLRDLLPGDRGVQQFYDSLQ